MKHEAALGLREACITAGLAFLLVPAHAEQDRTSLYVEVNGKTATVIADDAPLGRVVEEIALRSGIIVYSRAALDMHITCSIQDQRIPDLIRKILKQHNFTLHYVSDAATGLPLFGSRLWISGDDDSTTVPLWGVGQPATKWTLKYAAGDPERKRLQAISNVATWEDDAVAGADLLAALNDPSVAVREEAVHVLGELNDPWAMNYLENALYDPEVEVRVAAIRAIADAGDDSAAILLSDLLNDEDPSIRTAIIHALANIGGDVAQHYLQQALADANEMNRETAAEYLAEQDHTQPASRF